MTLPATDARLDRIALIGVLSLALAVRLWALATHTYIAFPDETFQYLEPAHRLAFGAGVITWEFIDGIRSWLLPGAIAGVMRLVGVFSSEPGAYIGVLRLMCVVASLSVPFVGYRLAGRYGGPGAAVAAGLLCALSPQAVYFAPIVMTEPLAADLALLAIWLGDGARAHPRAAGRFLLAGALFGLASALRYQYAPALAAVVLVQHVRDWRGCLLVAAGGVAVVLPTLGLLDAITWGAPFQSVWLNYLRNGPQGVSGAMGTESWSLYLEYFVVAWGALTPVLLGLLVYGAIRLPVLGVAVVCTIALHALPPHKELRFIFLATACVPILLGIGLASALRHLPNLRRAEPVTAVLALGVALYIAISTTSSATRPDDWHRDRSMLQATAAARAYPGACGLAIRTIWVYRSGGYSYWHRDLPIYFETWEQAQKLEQTDFRLRLDSVLSGQRVPQYPDAALAANTHRFNVMVGTRTDRFPGFTVLNCFGAGVPDDRELCLFVRPGGCD